MFDVQPESTTAAIGETATLTAEVSNATTYQWQYKRGTGNWTKLTETAAFVGVTTPSLTITQSEVRARNTYRLIATGEGGEAISNEVTVTIPVLPPVFDVQPESTTASVGETATLTAVVSNADTYQWQYKRGTGSWTNLTETAAFVGVTTPSMTVTQSTTRARNIYRLVATNEVGEAISDEVTISLGLVIDGVTYEPITTSTCRVVSYAGNASSLVIPSTVEGMTVTEIGEQAFMDNTTLVSIDLPNSITVIRARAFKNCTSLSQMTTH